MDITTEIKKIGEYFVQFNIVDGCAYIAINMPEKWTLPEIEYINDEFGTNISCEDNLIYFYAEIDDAQNVFDAVLYTIEMNKNIEEKMKLFNAKLEELKTLFADKDLEDLKTLTFTFNNVLSKLPIKKKKVKNDVKPNITEPEEVKEPETVVEEKIEVPVQSEIMEMAKSMTE